jgi:hypothetical protein
MYVVKTKVSLWFLHEMIRAGMGASYSLQYSHSIDMISDSITCFQQILRPLYDVRDR